MKKEPFEQLRIKLRTTFITNPIKACVTSTVLVIVLINLGFTAWAWQNWVVKVQSTQLEKITEQYANKVRSNLGAYVASTSKKLNFFTQSQGLEKAMADKDQMSMDLFVRKVQAGFEEVDAVRIIPYGTAELDLEGELPLRFSDLEMIKSAEARKPVRPEALKYKRGWRLNMVVPVPSDPSQTVVGTILVTLKMDMMHRKLVEGVEGFGRVVLLQRYDGNKKHSLFSRGEGQLSEKALVAVPDSLWEIEFTANHALKQQIDAQFSIIPTFGVIVGLEWLFTLTVGILLAYLVGRLLQSRFENASDSLDTLDELQESDANVSASDDLDLLNLQLDENDENLLGLADDDEDDLPDLEDSSLFEDEAEEDSPTFPEHVFRSYDIRGIAETEIDNEFCKSLGQALGSEAIEQGENCLIVAKDSRTHSPIFEEYLIRGILSTGCNVINIGTVPTPLLYYATETLDQTRSGVMVTASHNPAEYNGFKVVMCGQTRAEEDIHALRARMMRGDHRSGIGQEDKMDITKSYIDAIFSDVALAGEMSIVIDAGHGATGKIGPQLFEELGCEVSSLYCDFDGTFPAHGPDPSKPENLEDLIIKVQQIGADLGVAFDGDGDRLTVVTKSGQIIWPDRLMMLFASDILARNPGADVVYDVKCSRQLNQIISSSGGRPIMWKTGHAPMKSKIRETGALLGGEYSGHVFIKDRWFGFDDGLYAAARLIEIMSLRDEALDDIFTEFPELPNTPEVRVPVAEKLKAEIVEKLVSEGDFGDAKITTLDGLRADFSYGWGLVRASNTGPELTLRIEAETKDQLHELKSLFTRELRKIDNTISIKW